MQHKNIYSKVKAKHKIFLIIPLIFLSLTVYSQTYNIRVIDLQTHEAIPYAVAKIKNLSTNKMQVVEASESGELQFTCKPPFTLQINYFGYKQFSDTIKNHKKYARVSLEQDVFNIDDVVVTATRTNVLLKDAPVITHVVNQKEIETKGISSIETLLETALPGIEFQRHGASQDVDIQGLGGRNVLVLVDGERLAGETRGNIDYNRINTSDIQKVEIIKGAASALYGSQAMGAVINIITKKSRQKIFAEVSSGYKSRHEMNFKNPQKNDPNYELKKNLDKHNLENNILLGFNLGAWQSKTTFSLKTTDGFNIYDTDSLVKRYVEYDTVVYDKKNPNPVGIEGGKQFSIGQKIGYKFSEKLSAEANVNYYDRHKYDFYQEDKKHDYFNDIGYSAKVLYDNKINTTINLSFSADIYNKYDYKERLHKADLNYKDQFINPKLLITRKLNKHLALFGAEYHHEALMTDMFVYGELINKYNDTYTIFLQDEFSMNKMKLTAGFRGQYNSAFKFQVTPKLSFMYSLENMRIRANYSMGYRAPGLKELYMNWNHLDMFMIKGNADLRPEINHYASVSAEYIKQNFRASVTVFNNYFKDKIGGQWSDNQSVYSYANVEHSNLTGGDIFAKIKQGNFIFSGSYSYVQENNRDEDIRLSVISPHTGNMQISYVLNKQNYSMNLTLGAKYIGAKHFYVQDQLTVGKDTIDAYYPVDYKGYTIFRVSLHQQFYNCIGLNWGVENLLNYQAPMATFNSYVGIGRTYFVKINMNLIKLYNKIR